MWLYFKCALTGRINYAISDSDSDNIIDDKYIDTDDDDQCQGNGTNSKHINDNQNKDESDIHFNIEVLSFS